MLVCPHSRELEVLIEIFLSSITFCLCVTVCTVVCICFLLFVCVREKYTLEQDIRETEEAIRHKSAEVQVRSITRIILVDT